MARAATDRSLQEIQGRLEYDAQCVLDRGRALDDSRLIARGWALQREVGRLAKVLEGGQHG